MLAWRPMADRPVRPACPDPPDRRSAPACTAAVAAALLCVAWSTASSSSLPAPAPAAAAHSTGGANVLKDRVIAVVDDDPILATDLDRAIVIGQLEPKPGESQRAFRRRVLDDLIAQRLRFHEIDRFGLEQVPVDQIERH